MKTPLKGRFLNLNFSFLLTINQSALGANQNSSVYLINNIDGKNEKQFAVVTSNTN